MATSLLEGVSHQVMTHELSRALRLTLRWVSSAVCLAAKPVRPSKIRSHSTSGRKSSATRWSTSWVSPTTKRRSGRHAAGSRGLTRTSSALAQLVPEPTNRYDPNAVRVDIDGACVGYLSRADAVELGPEISEALAEHGSGLVRAVIAGRAAGETDNLGVFLHLRLGREIVPDHPG
jgi:hypothetical protein